MDEPLLAWLVVFLVVALIVSVCWTRWSRHRPMISESSYNQHDAVCDLPQRDLIETAIQTELDLVESGYGVVIFIDMDGFKPINDEYGKAGGDQVLKTLAARLKHHTAGEAFVSRYCSDEFIVYLPANAVHGVILPSYLERLQQTLSQPLQLFDREVSLTASIGFYRLNATTTNPALAIQAADIAMGESKRNGGGLITEFTDELNQRYQRELSIKSELQTALTQAQLSIVYQPIVDCKTYEIIAAEALVRWHRDDGAVPPSEFVPIAEQSRQIVELNQYILRQAVREFASLPGDTRLSVNIPASQLHATDLVADVRSVLAETGLPCERLYLELTETELVVSSAHVTEQLNGLRELGVAIALDDFGTGYSNLQYLQSLPVDLIKLDRSFIEGIGADEQPSRLTNSILEMLDSLDKYLIVEGIENEQQADYLRQFNVNALQGFYFHKPMALEALRAV